jgi:hypothetical protein
VLDAIVRCRTAALGAHRDQCTRCGHQAISYNSCLMGRSPLVVVTGTAPDVRATPAPAGSPSAELSCCRLLLSHRLHAAA